MDYLYKLNFVEISLIICQLTQSNIVPMRIKWDIKYSAQQFNSKKRNALKAGMWHCVFVREVMKVLTLHSQLSKTHKPEKRKKQEREKKEKGSIHREKDS